MAIKFEKVTAGMRLMDIHRHKLGNTTMSELGMWDVLIVSVDPKGATVRWNDNREQWWPAKRVSRLYAKPPAAYVEQESRRSTRRGLGC